MIYEFNSVILDIAEHRLTVAGVQTPLPPKLFDLLVFLVQNPDRLITKTELLDKIWSSQTADGDLHKALSQLRGKLGEGQFIENVPRIGYRFVATVCERKAQPYPGNVIKEIYSVPPAKGVQEENVGFRQELADRAGLSRCHISTTRLPHTGFPKLFGRGHELALLNRAWATERTNVVVVVALPGAGKTALLSDWLAQIGPDDCGTHQPLVWSFYDQGTTEDTGTAEVFFDEALRHFGGDELADSFATVSPWNKGEMLAHLIRQGRTLLILDGLEPLQYPPGDREGQLKDAALQALLEELAIEQPGLCVITTRLPVAELEKFEKSTVIRHDLQPLSPSDGAQLLRALNVWGDQTELEDAVDEYAGNALAILLLGSYIEDVCNGNILRRHEIETLQSDARHGRHAERVLRAFEKWMGPGIEVAALNLLGLFGHPAESASISALCEPPPIPGLTEPLQDMKDWEWPQALAKLRRIKLIDAAAGGDARVLDAHPLIRDHFRRQLKSKKPDGWREANRRLYEHYRQITSQFPSTVAEMSLLYEAVHHGCEAGLHAEVYQEVYLDRILRLKEKESFFSTRQLGMYRRDLTALYGFFHDRSFKRPVANLGKQEVGFVLHQGGFDLRALGEFNQAEELLKASLKVRSDEKLLIAAASTASSLSQLVYLTRGDLGKAISFGEDGVRLAKESGNVPQQIHSGLCLAAARLAAGQIELAESLFLAAEEEEEKQPKTVFRHARRDVHYCHLLLHRQKYGEVQIRASETLESAKERGRVHAGLNLISLGRAHLLETQKHGNTDYSKAAEYLEEAVANLKLGGAQDEIPRGLLVRASVYRHMEDYQRAGRDLTEALRLAERGGMQLHVADYHLESARLYLEPHNPQRNLPKATEHLNAASKLIERIGYHWRDPELAELTRRLKT